MLKLEKETIFRLNSAEPEVAIYSCHPRVWRRLERKGYQPIKRHFRADQEIARSYRVPRNCFRFGGPRRGSAPPTCSQGGVQGKTPWQNHADVAATSSRSWGELVLDSPELQNVVNLTRFLPVRRNAMDDVEVVSGTSVPHPN